MSDTEQILSAAAQWHRDGRGVALATVVTTWGSSPRPVGSKLAVDDAGRMIGSVSGGCVEGAVVSIAGLVLDLIGFPHGLPPAATVLRAIPPGAVRSLGLFYGPGASLLTAVCMPTLARYRRGRADHESVRDALAQRRETT